MGLILAANTSIKELSFARNVLGLDGLRSLCLGLKANTSLQSLDLSSN